MGFMITIAIPHVDNAYMEIFVISKLDTVTKVVGITLKFHFVEVILQDIAVRFLNQAV